MSPIIYSAMTEERRLMEELRGNAVYQKLEAIQALLKIYRASESDEPTKIVDRARPTERTSPRAGSLSAKIIASASEILQQRQTRISATDIYAELSNRGIAVGGKKPVNALSSTLSHSAIFDNVRGEGYGLRRWSEPNSAPASADTPITPEKE